MSTLASSNGANTLYHHEDVKLDWRAFITLWIDSAGIEPEQEESAPLFRLRYARFRLDAQLPQGIKSSLLLALDSPEAPLLDAELDYTPVDYLQLRLGQFRLPFGHHSETGARKLTMSNRPAALLAMLPKGLRDLGLMVGSAPKHPLAGFLSIHGGIFAGQGKLRPNYQAEAKSIDDYLYLLRSTLKAHTEAELSLGLSYAQASFSRRTASQKYALGGKLVADFAEGQSRLFEADLSVGWHGFHVHLESMYLRAKEKMSSRSLQATALTAEGDYVISGWNTQPAVQISYLDQDQQDAEPQLEVELGFNQPLANHLLLSAFYQQQWTGPETIRQALRLRLQLSI